MKKKRSTILLLVIFFVGLSVLLYPTLSNYWNSFHQSRAIASYTGSVAKLSKADYEKLLENAQGYNTSLVEKGSSFSPDAKGMALYNSLLNIGGTGVMGSIEIPKIGVDLPIYHGTSDTVLQVAIGHIAGTSLPVGGAGTHCVLSGHRGLPSAKLFTNLDKLEEGDTFTIKVLNETLTYQVDQIAIVLPNDTSKLQIVPGKDYVTLVTCTPYGINTHRLLVRGVRIANPAGSLSVSADAIQIDPVQVAPVLAAPILVLLLILLLTGSKRKSKRQQDK